MGSIDVTLATDSGFLGHVLPFEVRDSSLRLVRRTTGASTVSLPVGLYEVSAVLGDGRRHSALVQVTEGHPTPVRLGSELPTEAPSDEESAATSDLPPTPVRDRRPPREDAIDWVPGLAPDVREEGDVEPIELLEVDGATVVDRTPMELTFQCEPAIEAVPSALFRIGSRRQRISLPISPQLHSPSGGCVVVAERTSGGTHAQAWIGPERKVANGLQHLLSAGYVTEGARLAGAARELLHDKYVDAPAAALGALLLRKVGQLEQWTTWVETLARADAFRWLPDGKVLLVELRLRRGQPTQADLDLAIEASGQRIMYAETYSLLLDLLRRWPTDAKDEAHQRAVQALAARAPYLDRETICLNVWEPGEG
jgi:hypothetical protein